MRTAVNETGGRHVTSITYTRAPYGYGTDPCGALGCLDGIGYLAAPAPVGRSGRTLATLHSSETGQQISTECLMCPIHPDPPQPITMLDVCIYHI